MPSLERQGPVSFIMVVLVLLALLTGACRKQVPSVKHTATQELAGEPQHYSATVVRTVEGGGRTEVRVARSGDMRRQEWNQDGETRVSIWRPDLGRVFLLSVERQVYVESHLGEYPQPAKESGSRAASETGASTRGEGSPAIHPEAIDRAVGDESSPERVETEELPEEIVDGRSCRAIRQTATFADGHVETTLMFCAGDLEGLAIRVESETEGATGRVKLLTEWRDIRTDTSPEKFVVPTGFKRVNSL